jgi:hypothetical protein
MMDEDDVLATDEINTGLDRLTAEERDQLASIIGSVENQPEFRKQVRELGRRRANNLLNKAFPDRSVTIQDLRRCLCIRIAEMDGVDTAKELMWGSSTETVGDINSSSTEGN